MKSDPGKTASTISLRKKRCQTFMADHGWDALVATTPENVAYSTGYISMSHWRHPTRRSYAIMRARGDSVLIVSAGSADSVFEQRAEVDVVRTYGRFFVDSVSQIDEISARFQRAIALSVDASPITLLANALLGCKRVGLDEQRVTSVEHERLQGLLAGAVLEDAYDIWRQIRAVKDHAEVALIEKATHITEDALMAAVDALSVGASEAAAALEFRTEVVRQGAIPTFFWAGAGYRGAWPDVQPVDRVPGTGEPVRFDVGCIFEGYHADIARTAIKPPVPATTRLKYDALVAGLEAGLASIRPGESVSEVFAAAMTAIRQSGIPTYERHHLGHGEGLEGYDLPSITPEATYLLEPGMVMCVETPYYELGVGGLHIEDTLVVTERGYRLLSRLSRDLIEL